MSDCLATLEPLDDGLIPPVDRHKQAGRPWWNGVILCVLVLHLIGCAARDHSSVPWPSLLVPIEQMRMTAPLRTSMDPAYTDRSGVSSVTLLVHVDAQGRPVRWKVQESSGNARLDEAAMHTAREAKFAPYILDGVAKEVTVIARLKYPFKERANR